MPGDTKVALTSQVEGGEFISIGQAVSLDKVGFKPI
jgi:hypothetical protein